MFVHWFPKNQQKRISYFQSNPINPKPTGLLPVRPRLYKDELLSSWLVRLATANGVSPSCFATVVLGVAELRWLGTIDTWEIPNFLERLEALTGVVTKSLRKHAFYHFDRFWSIPGIAPINGFPTFTRMEFEGIRREPKGLRLSGAYRACIQCWQEDEVPYVRSTWRHQFTTTCVKHKVILVDTCANCCKPLNASFSRSLALTKYFHNELSVCRHCGGDFRNQDQPLPRYCFPDGYPMSRNITLEPYLEIEEIFQRSYGRGWFSLADAERLLNGPTPHLCPWDWRDEVSIYPYISEQWARRRSLAVRAEDFQCAFNDWVTAEYSR
jgi:hypothetical protein